MLVDQRQPDAANDPPLRLLADVDAASRLPETFAVAASPVRHSYARISVQNPEIMAQRERNGNIVLLMNYPG